MYKAIMTFLEEVFVGSSWVIAFLILCFGVYERSIFRTQNDFNTLQEEVAKLQQQKDEALLLTTELQLMVNSQSDPAWIELTLMKVLGLVPEGQIKIYLPHEEKSKEAID